jgi:hypothetical protein
MDVPHISPDPGSTFFAPAERSSPAKLEEQRAGYLADDLADALMQAMPGYAMLINQQRQIVAANSNLLRIPVFTAETP